MESVRTPFYQPSRRFAPQGTVAKDAGVRHDGPMESPREATTNARPSIRYWHHGGSGPRVLLIMGFGMRGEMWRPQIDGLAGDHQLAWFDNRGIGGTAAPASTWTMADMAKDAVGVADALGWDRFHLVGVSMGGMIAQELAIRESGRLISLALIATHEGGNPLRWAPRLAGLRAFAEAQVRTGEARLKALRHLLYPAAYLATCNQQALGARMKEQLGRPAPRATLLGQLSAVARHNTGRRLESVRLPTLIIKPCLDVLVPPSASDRLRKRLPHARFLPLEDAGHGAIFQSRDVINEALREHFAHADVMELMASSPSVHA